MCGNPEMAVPTVSHVGYEGGSREGSAVLAKAQAGLRDVGVWCGSRLNGAISVVGKLELE